MLLFFFYLKEIGKTEAILFQLFILTLPFKAFYITKFSTHHSFGIKI